MSYAYLAAVTAGVNFYWTVDDTPLAAAMHSHPALFICFRVVAIGSFVAFGAVVAVAVPVVRSMMRAAVRSHRWDVVSRVAFPFGAAALTIAWMLAAGTWAHLRWGGPWVPTPWDVAGAWKAPPGWPPLTMRLALSSVTFVLLVAGLIGSAISVAQAIHRSDLSGHHPLLFKATAAALAASIATMAAGITAWGWFAERDAPIAFHSGAGGSLSIVTVASWLASTAVFFASSIIALRGARSAIASSAE